MTCHYFEAQTDGSNYFRELYTGPYTATSYSKKSLDLRASLSPRDLGEQPIAMTSFSFEKTSYIKLTSSYSPCYTALRGEPYVNAFFPYNPSLLEEVDSVPPPGSKRTFIVYILCSYSLP